MRTLNILFFSTYTVGNPNRAHIVVYRYVTRADGTLTPTPRRVTWYFPLTRHLMILFSNAANVKYLTEWYDSKTCGPGSPEPTCTSDYRHGTEWRNHFLRGFGESRYNVCVSLTADGIRKGSLTQKSVFPISVRIESLPPNVRSLPEANHMLMLLEGNYENMDTYMIHVAAELKGLAEDGVAINVAGVGLKTVRVHVGTIEGDLRALPSLVGKYRDPAMKDACLNCRIEGSRHGPNRTVYLDADVPAPKYEIVELGVFKRIPVIGCAAGEHEMVDKIAYCAAHQLKLNIMLIFSIHGNVNTGNSHKVPFC